MTDPVAISIGPRAASAGRYLDWLQTLALWDGCLPLAVGAVGPIARGLFPGRPEVATLCAVFVPIFAFFLRLRLGSRHFESRPHYRWQSPVFFVAIFWLVLLDAVLILFRVIPNCIDAADWRQWGLMYGGYVCLMAAAMFPREDAAASADGRESTD